MRDVARYSMVISNARGNTVRTANELVPSIVTAVAKNVMPTSAGTEGICRAEDARSSPIHKLDRASPAAVRAAAQTCREGQATWQTTTGSDRHDRHARHHPEMAPQTDCCPSHLPAQEPRWPPLNHEGYPRTDRAHGNRELRLGATYASVAN